MLLMRGSEETRMSFFLGVCVGSLLCAAGKDQRVRDVG